MEETAECSWHQYVWRLAASSYLGLLLACSLLATSLFCCMQVLFVVTLAPSKPTTSNEPVICILIVTLLHQHRYTVLQKCLNKWTQSALLWTRRTVQHSSSTPTPTLKLPPQKFPRSTSCNSWASWYLLFSFCIFLYFVHYKWILHHFAVRQRKGWKSTCPTHSHLLTPLLKGTASAGEFWMTPVVTAEAVS